MDNPIDPCRKIVIADDEVETLGFMSKILTHNHFEVFATQKGKEVAGLVNKNKPDLIILDLMMPDMRGEEIAAMLARDPETAAIPIIFITALLAKGENDVPKKIRGKYYTLAKPIMMPELLNTIREVLSNK